MTARNSAERQLFVMTSAQGLFRPLSLGDVAIDFEDAGGKILVVMNQHLTALHRKALAVARCVAQFPVPLPLPTQACVNFRG